jgi:hypothetical protein
LVVLRLSWDAPGMPWEALGVVLGPLGATNVRTCTCMWKQTRARARVRGAMFGSFGVLSGWSWGLLGRSWETNVRTCTCTWRQTRARVRVRGAMFGYLGVLLGGLGASWGALGRRTLFSIKNRPKTIVFVRFYDLGTI